MSVASLQLEAVGSDPQFRHLSSIAGIAVDLRYATPDNFVGRDLYSPIDCAWLHRDAAAALEQAVAWLAAHRPDHHLLVLDALRPQRVQQQLWDALAGNGIARLYRRTVARLDPLIWHGARHHHRRARWPGTRHGHGV